MTTPHGPASTPEEDALFAFGGDWNAAPSNDLERTMLRVQRATDLDATASSSIPTDLKHQIWEDLMHAQPATSSPITESQGVIRSPIAIPSVRGLTPPVLAKHLARSPLTHAINRSQPAVSLAVVVAFLVGLVGIAYQRGVLNEPPPPLTPAGYASQVMYDSDDASTFPEVPAQCTTNGAVESDESYADMSIRDWPLPSYTPVRAVTPEMGERIQQTYFGFIRCQNESTNSFPFPEATPTSYRDVLSPLALSYFSDRARFALLYPELDATQQAEIDANQCGAGEEILANFPLPVNQPFDYALLSSTVDNLPRVVTLAFAPSDVYLLPDGRFGAIIGTLSTAALKDPSSATDADHLTFIAFMEEDGRYLIDEEFVIISGVQDRPATDLARAECD